jgi:hypothetical protein
MKEDRGRSPRPFPAPVYHRQVRLLLITLWAPLLLVACAAGGGGADQTPSASPAASGSNASLDPGDVPAGVFNQIVADAAAKTGVDPSAITVLQSSAVTWSDGSLGCPRPGVMYTQSRVEGFRVILEANDVQLDYHGANDTFVLCPAKLAKPPVG